MSNNNWPIKGFYGDGCGALDLSGNDHSYSRRPFSPRTKDASTQYEESDFGRVSRKKDASTQYEEQEIRSPPRKKFKGEKPKRRLADINMNTAVKPSGSYIGWSAYQKSLKGNFLERLFNSPTEEKYSQLSGSSSSQSPSSDPSSCSGTWTSSSSSATPGPSKSAIHHRITSTDKVLPQIPDIEYISTKQNHEYRDPRMTTKTQSEQNTKSRDPRQAAKQQTAMASTSKKKDYENRDPRVAARKQKEQVAAYDDYCAQLYYEQMRRSEVSAYLAQHYGLVDDGYEESVNWDFEDTVPLALTTSKKTEKNQKVPKYKMEDDDPPHIFNTVTKMYYPLFSGDQVQLEAEIHHPPSSGRPRKQSESSLEADKEVEKIMSVGPPDDFDEIIVIPATPESSTSGSPPLVIPKRAISPAGSMSPTVGSHASSSPPKSPSNMSDYSCDEEYSDIEYPEEEEEIDPKEEEEKHKDGKEKNVGGQVEFKEGHFAHGSTLANAGKEKKAEPAPREQPGNKPKSRGYEFDEIAYMNWIFNSTDMPKRRHSTS